MGVLDRFRLDGKVGWIAGPVCAAMQSKVPLGRWGSLEEIGPPAVFLASEASTFMTGALLFIDGG